MYMRSSAHIMLLWKTPEDAMLPIVAVTAQRHEVGRVVICPIFVDVVYGKVFCRGTFLTVVFPYPSELLLYV